MRSGAKTRVSYICAPTPAREPLLTDRPGRPRHLDLHLHGRPRHADRLLARLLQGHGAAAGEEQLAGPVQSINDIRNRKVATTSGSIYDRWMKRCSHQHRSGSVTDSFTNALLAFNQGRADALMWDDTVLVGVAAADPSAKLTNDTFLALPSTGSGSSRGTWR